jgi:hypothetical protein
VAPQVSVSSRCLAAIVTTDGVTNVAAAAGVSAALVQSWAAGKSIPTLPQACGLEKRTGVSTQAWMFTVRSQEYAVADKKAVEPPPFVPEKATMVVPLRRKVLNPTPARAVAG